MPRGYFNNPNYFDPKTGQPINRGSKPSSTKELIDAIWS